MPGDNDKTRGKSGRPRRRGRKLLVALGLVVVLVVVLVALAPTIASGFASGIIAGRVSENIAGTAQVRGVSLSWFGGQSVESVTLFDPDGTQAADVSVRAGTGLLSLATGSLDLGEVVVSGWASAEAGPDGRTRIERATEPVASGSTDDSGADGGGEGGSVPSSLKATVRLDAFEVRTDAGPVVLDGEAGIAAGAPVTIALTGAEGGRQVLALSATLSNLIGADGAITIDAAGVDAQGSVTQAPSALLDAFIPSGVLLTELLGERVDAGLNAKGTMDALDASVSVESAGLSAVAAVRKTGDLVEQVGAVSLRADGARVARALPALRDALASNASLEIEAWPEVTLELEGLRAPLDSIAAGDYRGTGARATVAATPTRALVPTGVEDGARGTLLVSGLELTLAAPDLGGPVSVEGGANATLDGRDAGELVIRIQAPTLLDASGGLLEAGSAEVSGGVTLAGVAAQTLQPFVEGTGLVVARDLGPEVTLRATAERAGAEANRVGVTLESAKVGAMLGADVVGNRVTLAEAPGVVTLRDPGATIAGFLGESGVALVAAEGPYTITLETLDADLTPLMQGGSFDVRRVSATASADVPGLVLDVPAGEQAKRIGVRGLALAIDARDLAKGLGVTGTSAATIDGAPGGDLSLTARLTDLFDDAGALAAADAALASTLELTGIPASAAQAFLPADTLVVGEDVGETLDARVTASRARVADAPIEVDLSAGGERARLSGALAYSSSGIRTRGDGLTITQHTPGRLVNRLGVLPEGGRIDRVGSALEARVSSLNVPTKSDGGLDIAGASLRASAGIRGARGVLGAGGETFDAGPVAVTLARETGGPAAYTLKVDSLALQSPDGAGVVGSLDASGAVGWGVLTAGEGGVANLKGTANLAEGGADAPAGGGARLGTVALDASVPVGQAGAVSANAKGDVESLATIERAIGREGMLTGALGDRATFDATWTGQLAGAEAEGGASAWDLTASIESPRLRTTGPVRATSRDGALRLLEPARASWTVDPAWATSVALGEDPPVRLDAPIAMNVRVDRLVMPTGGEGNLDVEAAFTSNAVVLAMEDGTRLEYTGLDASAKTGENPEYVDVRATMLEKGAAADAPKAVEVVATLGGLGGPSESVAVSGYANLRNAPTAFIDAVSGMDGLLLSFLGERSSAHIKSVGLSKTAGELTASVSTTHASATYAGRVREGSLVSTKPTELTVNAITREFGFELVKVIPVFGSIEKQAGTDRPAKIIIDTLSVPVDGRDFVSNLAAAMRIDPGDASLTLAGGVGKFLKADEGIKIGRRMPAFPVNVAGGAVNYDGVQIPMGEFALTAGGKVDLVNKTQNVRVGVPAGALAAEAAGGQGGIGRVFDQALGVSLVNEGAMGKGSWQLKLGGGGQRKPGDALKDLFNIGG